MIAAGAIGKSCSSFSELFVPEVLAGIPTGALDYAATEPCVLMCAATLGPCYYNT